MPVLDGVDTGGVSYSVPPWGNEKSTPHVLAQITAAMRVYERDVLKEVTWQP